MNYCFRCGLACPPNEVHIVWGDEARKKAIEDFTQRPVSLCLRPVNRIPEPILCSCGRYVFDFVDIPCPLCGAIYVGGPGRP